MRTGRIGTFATFSLLLIATACQPDPDDDRMSAPAPPPAALIAPVAAHMSLDERLERLETELAAAIAAELREDGVTRLYRAEAITDRLLEGEPPFAWLEPAAYFVETRLRQLQAQADRIVARSRRSEPRDQILPEVVELHHAVTELRAALRAGGGEPPVPLDSLLAGAAADTLGPLITDEPVH